MAQRSNIPNSQLKDSFGFHPSDDTTRPLHEELRAMFLYVAMKLNRKLPDGRAKSVAITELENAAMWSHKAIAQMTPVEDIVEEP